MCASHRGEFKDHLSIRSTRYDFRSLTDGYVAFRQSTDPVVGGTEKKNERKRKRKTDHEEKEGHVEKFLSILTAGTA